MSFFGMGPMEILLILLIAFVFLGPERMLDAARLLGKAVREGRRLASELPRVVIEDDDIKIVNINESPSSDVAKSSAPSDDVNSPEPPPEPPSQFPSDLASDLPSRVPSQIKDTEGQPSAADDPGALPSTPRESTAERDPS